MRTVLDDGGPDLVYQPIVDLRSGAVKGFEALSRFERWGQARPDEWFARAAQVDLGPALQAAAAAKALAEARTLPNGLCISVNLSIASLVSDVVQQVLESQRSLRGLVIELTDIRTATTTAALPAVLANARAAGARIAVDEPGSGYAGLQSILAVRPDIVKLDRTFTSGIDADPAKLALAEMVGTFANRIDARVLAEGIERIEELDAVLSLGVQVGQGFLLGRAEAEWTGCAPIIVERIRQRAQLVTTSAAGSVMVRVATEAADRAIQVPGAPPRVLVDQRGAPVGFCLAGGPPVLPAGGPLVVPASEPAGAVLAHAMARAPERRWEAIVTLDDDGRVTGLVLVDDLARATADQVVREHRPGA